MEEDILTQETKIQAQNKIWRKMARGIKIDQAREQARSDFVCFPFLPSISSNGFSAGQDVSAAAEDYVNQRRVLEA